ncbi:MAG: NUDIX domain-containing protein [Myxococcota bacterium]|nr:NUDIX domain-containing protein [Myxococcota bacterium]
MPRRPQAEPVPSVGAVVVDRAGRVLLVRRAHPPMAGAWTLPGGRVESGESLDRAAVREVFEETSIIARVVCSLGAVGIAREGFEYTIHEHLLVPLDPATTPVAGDDAADARWAARGDALALGIHPDALAVIQRGIAEALRRGLIGAVAVALVLFACSACARIAPPPSSPPTADAALARMHATFACGNAIQASAKIDHFGEHGRVRGDLMLFAERPARLRMDLVSAFGVALATLTTGDSGFALADLREKRFYVGPASGCNIARLTTVPVPGHVLVDLLRGEAPVLRHTPQGTTIAWSSDGYWVLAIASTRDAREEIHLAPRPEDWRKPWDEQRMRVLDVLVQQQNYVLYHAQFSDHTSASMAGRREDPDGLAPPLPPSGPVCDAEIPRKIHVEVPEPEGSDVRFQYQELLWNPPLPEGIFAQPVMPGMHVERVTCE